MDQTGCECSNRLTQVEERHAAQELDEELVGCIGNELEWNVQAPHRGPLRDVVHDHLDAGIEGELLVDNEAKRHPAEEAEPRARRDAKDRVESHLHVFAIQHLEAPVDRDVSELHVRREA